MREGNAISICRRCMEAICELTSEFEYFETYSGMVFLVTTLY